MTSDASDTNIQPITVISMPIKGTIKATSCPIDQCCTGSGMIAGKLVNMLGLQVIQTRPHSFNTANKLLTTNSQVNLTHVKLPVLFKQCKFMITLQIVSKQVTINHGVILGLETMKWIDLDTSVCDSLISWSNKLMMLMVSRTFWTKERLQKMVESLNANTCRPSTRKSSTRKSSPWTHNSSTIRPLSHIFTAWRFTSQSGGYQRCFPGTAYQPGCICDQVSTKWLWHAKPWRCGKQHHKPYWISTQTIFLQYSSKMTESVKGFEANTLESPSSWSSNPTQLLFGINHTPNLWNTEQQLKGSYNINAILAQWDNSNQKKLNIEIGAYQALKFSK